MVNLGPLSIEENIMNDFIVINFKGNKWEMSKDCSYCQGYGYVLISYAHAEYKVYCIRCKENLEKILKYYSLGIKPSPPENTVHGAFSELGVSVKEIQEAFGRLFKSSPKATVVMEELGIEVKKKWGESILKQVRKHFYRKEKTKEWIIKFW